jgi:hypothetical protein
MGPERQAIEDPGGLEEDGPGIPVFSRGFAGRTRPTLGARTPARSPFGFGFALPRADTGWLSLCATET